MADVTGLCNRALLAVGSRSQVSSVLPVSDGSVEADACAALFIPTFETLARAAKWSCLRVQDSLALVAAAANTPQNPNGTPPFPDVPWLYSYAHPSDALFIRYLIPPCTPGGSGGVPLTTVNNQANTIISSGGSAPYQISADRTKGGAQRILTNLSQAIAVYTLNQPNPVYWDSMFQTAFVASLAAFLAPPLNLNMALMSMAISTAERMIEAANGMDANEGVTIMDREADWIIARGAGSQTGSWPTYVSGGYGMSWPAVPGS